MAEIWLILIEVILYTRQEIQLLRCYIMEIARVGEVCLFQSSVLHAEVNALQSDL